VTVLRCGNCHTGVVVDELPAQFTCRDCGTLNYVVKGQVYAIPNSVKNMYLGTAHRKPVQP